MEIDDAKESRRKIELWERAMRNYQEKKWWVMELWNNTNKGIKEWEHWENDDVKKTKESTSNTRIMIKWMR